VLGTTIVSLGRVVCAEDGRALGATAGPELPGSLTIIDLAFLHSFCSRTHTWTKQVAQSLFVVSASHSD
jgi:hypothetical protein